MAVVYLLSTGEGVREKSGSSGVTLSRYGGDPVNSPARLSGPANSPAQQSKQ